jgi:hypothetical protein
MAEAFANKQIDKRVVARYLRKGLIDEKEYAASQKALPDLEDQALPVEAALEGEITDDPDDAE